MTAQLWKPLLSATLPIDPVTEDFSWKLIPFSVWASPKLDGFRATVQRGTLVSRNGLPIRNRELQSRYGNHTAYEGLDSELTDGPANGVDVFHRTSKIVTSATADASNVVMNVIDYNNDGASIEDRYNALWARYWCPSCRISVIPQTPVENLAQLKRYEKQILGQGYEGVMLRRMDQGAYPQKSGKQNRSTLKEFYLCRLKRFEQADAVIVAVHPLRHNENEDRTARGARSSKKSGMVEDLSRVGSATLRDCKTGVEFDTSIATEALRTWTGWSKAIGHTVRYKYQLIGTKDKPRINTCAFDELEVRR